jgi:hypothetical protein
LSQSCRSPGLEGHMSHGAGVPPSPALGGRHTLGRKGLGDCPQTATGGSLSDDALPQGGVEGPGTTEDDASGPLGG